MTSPPAGWRKGNGGRPWKEPQATEGCPTAEVRGQKREWRAGKWEPCVGAGFNPARREPGLPRRRSAQRDEAGRMLRRSRRRLLLTVCVCGCLPMLLLVGTNLGRNLLWGAYTKVRGRKSVADRVQQYGVEARERMAASFKTAGVAYPPGVVTLLALKAEGRLEVHAGNSIKNGDSYYI